MARRNATNIFGVKVDRIGVDGVLKRIQACIEGGMSRHIAYVNAHCLNISCQDSEYRQILLDADLVYSDGMAAVWASYFYGEPLPERVNLGDFLLQFCQMCAEKNYKIFLLGGEKNVAEKAAVGLQKKIKSLKIAGTHHGFFKEDENRQVIDRINGSSADILLVGMGVPKQEKWIAQNRSRLNPAVLWGVGALFDYYSGKTRHAPLWMRKAGIEWLFRVSVEPRRLWKRYTIGNLAFLSRLFFPAIADIFFVSAVWFTAYGLRLLADSFFARPIGPLVNYLCVLPLMMLAWPFICSFFGLYRKVKSPAEVIRMANMLKASASGFAFCVIISYAFRETGIARSFLIIWAGLNFIVLAASRNIFKKLFLQDEAYEFSEDETLLDMQPERPSFFYILFKEVSDKIIAFFSLIVILPLWPIIAIAIKLDSKGPAIFTHERVGREDRVFKMYKFRTMFADTPPQEPAPLDNNDKRITRVGRFLRRWSLDELLQFINVLKGDMSIVGPRPEMAFIVKDYKPWQRKRLAVKPGITGLWQITGRKDMPLSANIEYDLYYIKNRSLLLDLAIIIKTIPAIILKRGAY